MFKSSWNIILFIKYSASFRPPNRVLGFYFIDRLSLFINNLTLKLITTIKFFKNIFKNKLGTRQRLQNSLIKITRILIVDCHCNDFGQLLFYENIIYS